jgi:hypothetical protein
MMKRYLILPFLILALSGCATAVGWVPSFWDDNQSSRIIDIQVKINQIDCALPQAAQVKPIQFDLEWFKSYSTAKGVLQKDVIRLTAPMKETVDVWAKRGSGSTAYCELKKKILAEESRKAAAAVLGRW